MRTSRKVLLLAVCGALAGLEVALILSAIAVPSFSKLPLPWPQAAQLARVSRIGALVMRLMPWGALAGSAAAMASWILLARELNPRLPESLFQKGPRQKVAWPLTALAGLAVGIGLWNALSGPMSDLTPAASAAGAALAMAGAAVGWIILAPSGWAGTLESWRRPWAAGVASWASAGALGALFGGAVFLGALAVERLFLFLFTLNTQVWHPSSTVRADAIAVSFGLLTLFGSLSFLSAWSLARALAPDEAPGRERLRRALPALGIMLACAATAAVLRLDAARRHDWTAGSLSRAAALPDETAAPRLLIALGDDGHPRVVAKPWEMVESSNDFGLSQSAAATPANVDALMRFLAGRGASSRYRGASIHAIFSIDALLWEPEKAFAASRALAQRFEPPLIHSFIERVWLVKSAPITPENRARLAELSDPKLYRLEGRNALALAQGWARFGDLERSRAWLETARATGTEPAELKTFEVPARAPLTDGAIQGRVRVSGAKAGPVRVGLFRVADEDKVAGAPYHSNGLLVRLTAAQDLGPDGRFAFRNLSAGRYELALLLPADALGAKAPNVSGNPGIIVVGRSRSRVDAGTITISAGH